MLRSRTRKPGIVAVLVALSLVIIVGVAAIAIDGGLLLENRRRLQAAADAAALAAAADLYRRYPANLGVDVNNTARDCARSNAAANGYDNNGTTNTVTVNVPPTSGDYVGTVANPTRGYAEVMITYQQPRGFSGIFGGGNLPVTARAVAMGKWTDLNNGMIVLDPHDKGTLNLSGQSQTIVVGAGVVVNSDNVQAAVTTGQGAATAPVFDVTGDISTSGKGTFTGTMNTGAAPVPDPLAYLPEPNRMDLIVQSNVGVNIQNLQGATLTLDAGVYHGGIKCTANTGILKLNPGLYYMNGGGFEFTGQAVLQATGVMIYNDPQLSSHVVSLAGGSNLHMSPITTGIYKGITVFQRRSSYNTLSITGSGNMSISGTFYAAHGAAMISGQGGNNVMGSQYIVWQADLSGQGVLNVSWTTDTVRVRIIRLVE